MNKNPTVRETVPLFNNLKYETASSEIASDLIEIVGSILQKYWKLH